MKTMKTYIKFSLYISRNPESKPVTTNFFNHRKDCPSESIGLYFGDMGRGIPFINDHMTSLYIYLSDKFILELLDLYVEVTL